MVTKEELKIEIIESMMREPIVGGHSRQIQTITGWIESHDQGKAKQAIDEMLSNPDAPIQKYGGRNTIQLTSIEHAVEFLEEKDAEIPWEYRD